MPKPAVFCYRSSIMSVDWANRSFPGNRSAVKRIVIDPDTTDDGKRHDGSLLRQSPVVQYRGQGVEIQNAYFR